MIQMLTRNGEKEQFEERDIVVNKIHEPVSFDSFEINIINLQDKYIWRNNTDNHSICIQSDFVSLSRMIENSSRAYIIILMPQNYEFKYSSHNYEYYNNCEIKDMLPIMRTNILNELWQPLEGIDLIYEINATKLMDIECRSEFCFQENDATDTCTRSEKSNKLTTINFGNIFLSTICLEDGESVKSFLRVLKLIQDKQEPPAWMDEIQMFNDVDLETSLGEKLQALKQQEEEIDKTKAALEQNQRYESILYTTDDELVEVVFEILENMLGCDLSDFVDKYKEDFRFEIDGTVFIGEIKGVSKNVKNSNVSQVDHHVQEYNDENSEDDKKVVGILIINSQRDKSLKERAEVGKEQIDLAEKYGVLIVETITLLKLYERYLANEIDREYCIEILETSVGLLDLE